MRAVIVLRLGLIALLDACSAPAPPPQLARAEQLLASGHSAEALPAFEHAMAACADTPTDRFCAAAFLGRAETLEQLDRPGDAAAAYESIPSALPDSHETAATALTRAAHIHLLLGADERAYALAWRVITVLPDTSSADEALRVIVADGRRRDPRALYGVLRDLYARLATTAIGDNLLWAMAGLARAELSDDGTALAVLDRLVLAHSKSPFLDDALWSGAAIARRHGDASGALRRLQALLARRETSWLVGSYFSPHMPEAQLEAGRLLRDDLGRSSDALASFEKLERDYPQSTLRDDALFEIARTHAARQERAAACHTLADLARRFPESRAQVSEAPALAVQLGCGPEAGNMPSRP